MGSKPVNNKDMILDADYWPMWPYLPLVNRSEPGMPKSAYLYGDAYDSEGTSVELYHGNIWDNSVRRSDTHTESFDSVDTLLEAGWEVD